MDWQQNGVKIVSAGDLDPNTPQTPGMTRAAAITHVRTGQASCGPARWWSNQMQRLALTITANLKPCSPSSAVERE
jgi:hypothetical protein